MQCWAYFCQLRGWEGDVDKCLQTHPLSPHWVLVLLTSLADVRSRYYSSLSLSTITGQKLISPIWAFQSSYFIDPSLQCLSVHVCVRVCILCIVTGVQSWRCGPWGFCFTHCCSVKTPSVVWRRSCRPDSNLHSTYPQVHHHHLLLANRHPSGVVFETLPLLGETGRQEIRVIQITMNRKLESSVVRASGK